MSPTECEGHVCLTPEEVAALAGWIFDVRRVQSDLDACDLITRVPYETAPHR